MTGEDGLEAAAANDARRARRAAERAGDHDLLNVPRLRAWGRTVDAAIADQRNRWDTLGTNVAELLLRLNAAERAIERLEMQARVEHNRLGILTEDVAELIDGHADVAVAVADIRTAAARFAASDDDL